MVLVQRKKVAYRDVPPPPAPAAAPDATDPAAAASAAAAAQPPSAPTPATTSGPPAAAPPTSTASSSGAAAATTTAAGGGPAGPKKPDPDVFYLAQTGEIFLDYDSYATRIEFYNQKVFTCEATLEENLTFFDALQSEKDDQRALHARIPEALKAAVLRSVQFQTIGRIDSLTDAVHDRFSNRFFPGEKLYVEFKGDKYHARIVHCFKPTTTTVPAAAAAPGTGTRMTPPPTTSASGQQPHLPSSPLTPASARSDSLTPPPPLLLPAPPKAPGPTTGGGGGGAGGAGGTDGVDAHRVGTDLDLSQEVADQMDDPAEYVYRIQLAEERVRKKRKPKKKPTRKRKRGKGKAGDGESDDDDDDNDNDDDDDEGEDSEEESSDNDDDNDDDRRKYGSTLIDVPPSTLTRDRLSFSKTILRRFLRDCLDRDAALASPWVVKPALAEKYRLPREMTMERKEEVMRLQTDARDKRRKPAPVPVPGAEGDGGEAGEGDGDEGGKRRRRRGAGGDGGAEEGGGQSVGKRRKVAGENGEEGKSMFLTRKKPVKYPAEDFLCDISTREVKAGRRLQRPLASKALPFGELFETFLTTWTCLNALGRSLALSPFTLDAFEGIFYHVLTDPPNPLLLEIHGCLLNTIMDDPVDVRPLGTFGYASSHRKNNAEDQLREDNESEISDAPWEGPHGLTEARVLHEARRIGEGWSTTGLLNGQDQRAGWEDCLVGCLAERATMQTFPRLLDCLAHLLFVDVDPSMPAPSARMDSEPIPTTPTAASPVSAPASAAPASAAVVVDDDSSDDEGPSWAVVNDEPVSSPPPAVSTPNGTTTGPTPMETDDLAEFEAQQPSEKPTSTTTPNIPLPPLHPLIRVAHPMERYLSLPASLRLECVAFLTELAVQTKVCRDDMEESTNALTRVRNETQEVRRERKKIAEEKAALEPPSPSHPAEGGPGKTTADKPASSGSKNTVTLATVPAAIAPPSSVNGDDTLMALDDPDDALSVASSSVRPSDLNGDGESDQLDGHSEPGESEHPPSAPTSTTGDTGAGGAIRPPSSRKVALLQKQAAATAAAVSTAQSKTEEDGKPTGDDDEPVTAAPPLSKKDRARLAQLTEDDAVLAVREAALERAFRRQAGIPRARPLGMDRFFNRVWWLDGAGAACLVLEEQMDGGAPAPGEISGGGGLKKGQAGGPGVAAVPPLYGTGRLYIQGGTEADRQRVAKKCDVSEEEIRERRLKEEGEDGQLAEGEWAVYEEPSDIAAFLEWLNPKGYRETKLGAELRRWWPYLLPGAEQRHQDAIARAQYVPGRSTRQTMSHEQRFNPSMTYRNRFGVWQPPVFR